MAALARERLWLTDAYFIGGTSYVQALVAAARDGVDVRLLVPGASDIPLVRAVSRAGYRTLLEGGVRVLHLFSGPTEDEWFQPLPPPKVAYSQIAKSLVESLKAGLEDVYVGDVAQDFKARLDANPKALEREISQ